MRQLQTTEVEGDAAGWQKDDRSPGDTSSGRPLQPGLQVEHLHTNTKGNAVPPVQTTLIASTQTSIIRGRKRFLELAYSKCNVLRKMSTTKHDASSSLPSSSDKHMLRLWCFTCATRGFRAFSHFSPSVWNGLPWNTGHSAALSSFSRLKTFLFSERFS